MERELARLLPLAVALGAVLREEGADGHVEIRGRWLSRVDMAKCGCQNHPGDERDKLAGQGP